MDRAMEMKRTSGPEGYLVFSGLLFILVAATLLALHHMPHSVWNDEGLTVDIIHHSNWKDIVHGAMTWKPLPPLFFFLTRAGTEALPGHFGLRSVSLVFGLLSVIALYRLGKLLLGPWHGLLAAALMVSTPGVLFYFVDANPYTIMIFWSAFSLERLVKALRQDRPWDWIVYFLAALGGLASHTLFIFVLAGQWIYYLHAKLCNVDYRRKAFDLDSWKQQRKFLSSVCWLLFCWIGWVFFYFQNNGLAGHLHARDLFSASTLVSMIGLIPGPFTYSIWPHGAIMSLLVAAGLFSIWRFSPKTFIGLLLAWILPAIGITLFVKASLPFISYRYGLGVFPITCLFATGVLIPSGNRTLSKCRVLGWVALFFCILLGMGQMAVAPSSYFTYSDWIGCNRYLMTVIRPQDRIWFTYEGASFPLQYYYPSPSQIVYGPSRGGRERVQDLLQRYEQASAAGGRIWVVSPDFSNTNGWIERFTRTNSKQYDREINDIGRRLQSLRGLRLQQDQSFNRIKLYQLISP